MKLHRSIPVAAIVLTVCLTSGANAQNATDFWVSNKLKLQMTVNPPSLTELLSNGCFYSIGIPTSNYSPYISLDSYTNSSSTFFWESGRVALRVGLFSGNNLNSSTMGIGSAAFGYETRAQNLSFAGGYLSNASGSQSLAFGSGAAASSWDSVALGNWVTASGLYGLAVGHGTTASGAASVAMNARTLAAGTYSFAAGQETRADASYSFVIGRSNVGYYTGPNGGTDWNLQDPIFEIGIGADPFLPGFYRANALTVYKDGRVIIHKVQGDILMGDFQ